VSNRTVSEIGEHALISRITARLAKPSWVLIGPGDDAAVIRPERGALDVLTTDAQVEGVHFDRRFVPPEAIGHRALAVNISDLAAMGAAPRAALLSLVLPDELEVAFIDALMDGLLALADRHRVAVIGGNITRSPGPLMLDITAMGSVKPRRILTRSGARPGDELFVTGTIGGAAVGLQSLRAKAGGPPFRSAADVEADLQLLLNENEQQFLRPEPRVRAGLLLARNRAASACIDLSDGLADGLRQLAAASGVGVTVDEAAVPLARAVVEFHRRRGSEPVSAALTGGEDYELLFAVRPRCRGRLRAVRSQLGDLPITRIGVVTRDTRLIVRTAAGDRDMPAGYEHFRSEGAAR
jgi:thiamine-monophosphate kinase